MTTVGAERPLPPLHLCALGGGWSEVRRLLAAGEAQLEAPDPKGRTALFLCAMLGDLPGAQLLLRAGARADHADHAGQTPLHLAAHKGHKGLVRLLLSSSGGVPWARGDARGRTPLHLAAASGSPAQARAAVLAALLERADPGQVDLQDDHKQTALHKSALACHLESMAALLRKGANALLQDAEGRTPLHLCAASTRPTALACVRLLLECEASLVGWQDYRGCTPLHLAVASGTLPVIDLLTSWSECEVNALDDLFRTPLHWAAILGRREVVQLLLDRRADPSLADRTGATPLGHACCGPPTGESEALVTTLLSRHSAAKGAAPLHAALMGATLAGNAVAVRALLRHGVALDTTGAAAVVRAAASQGHLAVLQLLLDLRGVREAERQSGATRQTALMVAACGGHTPCLLALLDAAGTPSLHCTDSGGRTALHWAVVGDQACVCRLLVQRGCPVDAPDHQGRTALHYASSRGSSACVMVLLEVRADPNLTDAQGRTAMHWAARCGSLSVCQLLCRHGALLSVPDLSQRRATALDEACSSSSGELSAWLRAGGALCAEDVRQAAALAIQRRFRAWLRRRRLAANKTSTSAGSLLEEQTTGRTEAAAAVIQSAWHRRKMRKAVALADADEAAWRKALAHFCLLTGCGPIMTDTD